MRIIKPKLSIGGKNLYSVETLTYYRNSFELYQFLMTGNLFLWLRSEGLSDEYFYNGKTPESYYKLLKTVNGELDYNTEKKNFNHLYRKFLNLDYKDEEGLIEDVKKLMPNYEIFLIDKIDSVNSYTKNLKFDHIISLYSVLQNNKFKISKKLEGKLLYNLKNSFYLDSDIQFFKKKRITGIAENEGRAHVNGTVILTEISGTPIQLSLKGFQLVEEKRYEESKDINLSNHNEVTNKLVNINHIKVIHPSTGITYIEVPR